MTTLRPDVTIEALNRGGEEYLPGYLGIEIISLAENTLASPMSVKKLHVAPNEFLHAVSIVALADTGCGYATLAHLPVAAQSVTTIELKSNFLGTLREGGTACKATAQYLGAHHAGVGRGRYRRNHRTPARALSLHADDPVAEGHVSAA